MDKARSFEFVYRLPVGTLDELQYKEDVYDRQVLLNEEWEAYARRKGRSEDVINEEHVKWITETWEDYEKRKHKQCDILAHYDALGDMDIVKADEAKFSRKQRSDEVVARLMKFRDDVLATKTMSRHHLYADFDEYQRILFRRQQLVVETEEWLLRTKIEQWEDQDALFCMYYELSHGMYGALQAAREATEQAERRRIEEEHRRAIEEEKRREEQRRKDEEEAERQRREHAEAEKRLERRRREEERRARARADRERQREQEALSEQQQSLTPEPEPEQGILEEASVHDFVQAIEEMKGDSKINFESLRGDNLVSLLKDVTRILSSGGDCSYVMNIKKNPGESFVICQNGVLIGEHSDDSASILGMKISSDECISVSCPTLHSGVPLDEDDYITNHVVKVGNVAVDERCVSFNAGAEKMEETLLLLPVRVHQMDHSPYVVALCRAGADSLTMDEINSAGKLVYDLLQRLQLQMHKAYISQLCQQCVEWITVSTGCENVYISLKDDPTAETADTLTYVAATISQRFLIGQKHLLPEEKAGSGISFTAMETSTAEKMTTVYCYKDVSQPQDGPFPDHSVRLLGEGKKGPLIVAPITGERDDVGVSFGCVFLDRLGSKKAFSEVDQEITRGATQLLADILLGKETAPNDLHLKIEESVGGGYSPITFLKVLWQKTLSDLSQITPNQLLELAKYNHPPEIIPIVVQATLLVALGCKPKKIEEWGEARKRITKKLLEKMNAFDPTDLAKRKRAFFVRSRKLLKGHTAKDVFEKGSYPTQCFFKWVFTAILLRKHAENLQKKIKNSTFDAFETDSLYSNSTDGGDSIEEGDDEDFEDTVEEAS